MLDTQSSGAGASAPGKATPESYYLRIVLLLTAATYLGTVKFDFVSDDYRLILSNQFLKAWRYAPQYFSGSAWRQLFPPVPGGTYRPVLLLWARLNYAIFSDRSLAWHAVAVLLHVLATWLVFAVARKMTGRFTPAWVAALLFGVHPMHHEVVAWVWGSGESLFAVLFLAAFLAYLESLETSRMFWICVSGALYLVALLSNGAAIVLPVLVFAHAWITGGSEQTAEGRALAGRLKRAAIPAAFYIPIAAAYALVRFEATAGQNQPMSVASVSSWLLTLPSVLFLYARNWFFPARLGGYYDLYYQPHADWAHVLAPALVVAALAVAIWGLSKWLGGRDILLAAAWIVVPLLPALPLWLLPPDELAHDRYFYLPSAGMSLLVALCLERLLNARRHAFGQPLRLTAGVLAIASILAVCTVRASSFWRSDEAFFTRAHEIAPANSAAASGLSEEYIDQRQFGQAEALLQSAGENGSGDSRYLLNLGRAQYLQKQYDSAEKNIRHSIAVSPYAGEPYVYLGMIQLKQDHPHDALANLQRAVEISPEEAHFHTSYGIVLEVNGDCPAAISQFEAALALNPGDGLTQREIFRCRANSAAPGPAKP
jgi:protein O-mannosyl-transferase